MNRVIPLFEWETWKTIRIGTHRSVDSLRRTLNENECEVGDLTSEMFDRSDFILARRRTQIELVLLAVAHLRFSFPGDSPTRITRRDIYERAGELGLELCPAEVGLQLGWQLFFRDISGHQLLMQSIDRRSGVLIYIAMEPIIVSDRTSRIFCVHVNLSAGNRFGLHSARGHDDELYQPYDWFVFRRSQRRRRRK